MMGQFCTFRTDKILHRSTYKAKVMMAMLLGGSDVFGLYPDQPDLSINPVHIIRG
jgi:hypothetical protein